ncbi:glycoside hydrolase family 19 protein [Brenneria nigrifluens DSM 30175 = ATCC 13028]|uniref:Glycoside hydrolase family 19 protein n=1 Tax=Brenneria nigrifluens DSM 30175 = ATCC 13028 TaxID=1121120 RepID=A0A2U1USM2_9GAMM|nr:MULTISPECIES: glycoside hydrolase family 19 protein [Brenneria]EHD21536.1 glycoside hydrolase family 19 [Brenneria sp. EniD312]PWC24678.1 glycoside hydrolase family 19 protein [Brenneria nigrifluens DSM 30175 = ATCC 13028]QCR04657.1 glycoside hydrolase family 19 protein [Brenneria nigrifluens DSM 30175 = ATCC 13028]
MSLITPVQLQFAARIRPDLAERWHPHIDAALQMFAINTPKRIAAFIAQTAHESVGFTRVIESFNYSVGGLSVFGKRLSAAQREALGRHSGEKYLPLERQRAIANLVYGSRMGNKASSDGWTFRGRGLIQITGLENYVNCSRALGIDFVLKPELLETEQYAALSAGWFWARNCCNEFADIGDIVGMTRRINGGTNGLDERLAIYKIACSALGVSA